MSYTIGKVCPPLNSNDQKGESTTFVEMSEVCAPHLSASRPSRMMSN